MENNCIQTIYDNSPKIYRQITNKQFLKWFYIIFLLGILIFATLIIVGLVIPIKPNGMILLLAGVCLAPVVFVIFYIVEYIRRKAQNYYKNQFNFVTLYGSDLYDQKIVETPFQLDADFNNVFFRQQLEIFSRRYQFVNLHKNYATYKFIMKQHQYHLSYCNATVIHKDDKLLGSSKKAFQFIIASDYAESLNGIISLKDAYETSQIDIWKKQVHEQFDIYSNNNIKEWKKIIKLFEKLSSEGINLIEIKIAGNKIFYTFDFSEHCLLLGLSNVKFYKTTWKNLCVQHIDLQVLIRDIFNIIQIQP